MSWNISIDGKCLNVTVFDYMRIGKVPLLPLPVCSGLSPCDGGVVGGTAITTPTLLKKTVLVYFEINSVRLEKSYGIREYKTGIIIITFSNIYFFKDTYKNKIKYKIYNSLKIIKISCIFLFFKVCYWK